MVQFTVERVIDLPVDRAWEILSDFSDVHKVHPIVERVDQISERDRGLNAVRRCHFYKGGSATEKISRWDENAREYTVQLVEGSLPLKKVIGVLKARPDGDRKTKLVADFEMVAKYGLLGKLMEMFLLKPQFGKTVSNVFSGIEHYGKTGKEINEGYSAPTPALVK